ncbi:guanine nucleotide-binding protein subunit beta-like protein 1 [Sergentomyia squamirostris]
MAVLLPPDPVYSLRSAEMGPVHSVCFDSCERLCAGAASGRVFIWDLQTNRCSSNFVVGSKPIIALYRDNRGDTLLSQEKGAKVKLWQLNNCGFVEIQQIETESVNFCRIDCSDEKDLLLVPKNENNLDVHSTRDLSLIRKLECPGSMGALMSAKVINSEVGHVLAAFESGHFVTWDLRQGQPMSMEKLDESPMALDYDVLTNRGIVAGPSDKIAIFSYQRPEMIPNRRSDICLKNPGVSCLRIRPDRKVFICGGLDGRIQVFSWKSLRPLAVLTEHKKIILDIAFSAERVELWRAPLMAVAGEDSQVTLWDLYN